MKLKFALLILALILFIAACVALINLERSGNLEKLSTGQVVINGKVIDVEIAKSVRQQTLGLGKRQSLGLDSGMLFVFPDYQIRNFWMKDMNFPLDMIWIRDNIIIGIEATAPAPIPGQQSLSVYKSPSEANYVLEVNADFCAKNNIQIGDEVTVEAM